MPESEIRTRIKEIFDRLSTGYWDKMENGEMDEAIELFVRYILDELLPSSSPAPTITYPQRSE